MGRPSSSERLPPRLHVCRRCKSAWQPGRPSRALVRLWQAGPESVLSMCQKRHDRDVRADSLAQHAAGWRQAVVFYKQKHLSTCTCAHGNLFTHFHYRAQCSVSRTPAVSGTCIH